MGLNGRKEAGAKPPPSFEDRLQEEATNAATKAMGKMLWSLIEQNPNRPCCHLSEDELQWLVIAAISGWVLKRAEQAKMFKADVGSLIDHTPEITP